MSFVIYNKESTKLHSVRARSAGCWKDSWKSKSAATRAFNEAVKAEKINADEYAIEESHVFYINIEKTHQVRNIMSGKMVDEKVNTPFSCSVASENYWQS